MYLKRLLGQKCPKHPIVRGESRQSSGVTGNNVKTTEFEVRNEQVSEGCGQGPVSFC